MYGSDIILAIISYDCWIDGNSINKNHSLSKHAFNDSSHVSSVEDSVGCDKNEDLSVSTELYLYYLADSELLNTAGEM